MSIIHKLYIYTVYYTDSFVSAYRAYKLYNTL